MEQTISIRPEDRIRIISVWPSVGRALSKTFNRQRPALLGFSALTTLLSVASGAAAPAFVAGLVFMAALYPYTTRPIAADTAIDEKGGEA